MSLRLCTSLFLLAPLVLGAQSTRPTAPESFRASAQISGATGAAAATITIRIDRYTADADHEALASALKTGGQAAFLAALKKAPVVGAMKVGERSVDIRWARQRPQGDGRRIAVVTDGPVMFFGAGATDAKPTAGYEVGMAEFTVDGVGLGSGTMAGAAKVKAGGPSGVEVEDYAGKRIALTTVSRNIS